LNTVVDRTRSRLDVPKVRTLFGSKGRPHRKPGGELSPRQAVVIEKPRWNLTIFKVHFGLLTLKRYAKGERVLRFETIVHNTKQLGCGRTLDRFGQITTRLTAIVDRFTSMLDCVDTGFLPDGILGQLPARTHGPAGRNGQRAASGARCPTADRRRRANAATTPASRPANAPERKKR
jgi:hypothetical protein